MKAGCLSLLLLAGAIPSAVLAQQIPKQTIESMTTIPGWEVSVWAAEPDVIHPVGLALDERGRVWVAERLEVDGKPGFRISVLDDREVDGSADSAAIVVEEQSPEPPSGITLLGSRILLSRCDEILAFTIDADDRVTNREALAVDLNQGGAGAASAVVFGPDGAYYFGHGGAGAPPAPVEMFSELPDVAGRTARLFPDRPVMEVLANNFYRPAGAAMDSFGNIWQSDRGEPGQEWARLTQVFPGGNYGYWSPNGLRWAEDGNSHFHEENPGVVPSVLRIGAGDPRGMTVYEGARLPSRYIGQLLQADSGAGLVRAYFTQPTEAGFVGQAENLLESADPWFRPSDVAVADDGTLFISDEYAPRGSDWQPGVTFGRIYRLAPVGQGPTRPAWDLDTPQGRADALSSPSTAIRYLAHQRYRDLRGRAVPELTQAMERGNPFLRARALWLLGMTGEEGLDVVVAERRSADPRFRTIAVRVLERFSADFLADVEPLMQDASSQVRRQIMLALRGQDTEFTRNALFDLILLYYGDDPFYLEAISIASRGKEVEIFDRLLLHYEDNWHPMIADLIWAIRPPRASDYLKTAIWNETLPFNQRLRAIDVLAAQPPIENAWFLADFVAGEEPVELRERAAQRLFEQIEGPWRAVRDKYELSPAVKQALYLRSVRPAALSLAAQTARRELADDIAVLINSTDLELEIRAQAVETLGRVRETAYQDAIARLVPAGPLEIRQAALRGLGSLGDEVSLNQVRDVIFSDGEIEMRSEAVKALGRSENGVKVLAEMAAQGRVPAELVAIADTVLGIDAGEPEPEEAAPALPAGNAIAGNEIFHGGAGCARCHNVDGGERKLGPDLLHAAQSLDRAMIREAIVSPAATVKPPYQVWMISTSTMGDIRGMILDEGAEALTLRDLEGLKLEVPLSAVTGKRLEPMSAMPALAGSLSQQQLADLVEYLFSLK